MAGSVGAPIDGAIGIPVDGGMDGILVGLVLAAFIAMYIDAYEDMDEDLELIEALMLLSENVASAIIDDIIDVMVCSEEVTFFIDAVADDCMTDKADVYCDMIFESGM